MSRCGRLTMLGAAIGSLAIGLMTVPARASDQKLAWVVPGTTSGATPQEYALVQFAAPHEVVLCATNAVQVMVDHGAGSPTPQQATLLLAAGGCMILDAVAISVKNPASSANTGSFQDLGPVSCGSPAVKKASP